jgi:hypothetical protein
MEASSPTNNVPQRSAPTRGSWLAPLGIGLAVGILLGLVAQRLPSPGTPHDRSAVLDHTLNASVVWDPFEPLPGRVLLQRATAEQLESIPDKESVRELLLDAPRLGSSAYQLLRAFPRLEHLRIRAGSVDDEALQQIGQIATLKQLNLPQARFTDDGLRHVTQLERLELLRFGSRHVTDAGLEPLAQLPQLRFLHLIDTPITDQGLKWLERLERLESFYLDGSSITDAGVEWFLETLPTVHFHIDQFHDDRDPQWHAHGS